MIKDIILNAIKEIGIACDSIELEIPKHEVLGDISTPVAMTLARKLKRPPRSIADDIVRKIDANDQFEKVEVSGPGFINFTFKNDFLLNELKRIYFKGDSFFRLDIGKERRIQIEFVSANPTGPLHLGHGRGAALGIALANLLKRANYKVEKEFYINDAGRQVGLLGESVFAKYQNLSGNEYDLPDDGYKGDYIDMLAEEIFNTEKDRFSKRAFKDVSDFFIDYSYRRMLKGIEDDLNAFGVKFDNWQSERELFKKGIVEDSIEELREKGYVYKKDGAIWFKATEFGDEKDRVIIKSDGEHTYFASDISYHKMKIMRGYDEIINIWGADHHGYIQRMKAIIEAFGFNRDRMIILLVQMVTLLRGGKPVQMSKRVGKFVTLKEVIEEIGADITRFIFLTRGSDSQLEFDLGVTKKESSDNPVFYVQYAYARISSIFRKAKEKEFNSELKSNIDLGLLNKVEELRIIKKLILYPLIFESAVRSHEPHRITFYLQELSALFHQFYNKHTVLTEDISLGKARLMLCACVKIVLEEGLNILGISAPEKM